MSEKHISKLINGEVQLTPDVAVRLETVLGTPAKFWCNLEAIYREKLARIRIEEEMSEDLSLAEQFPYQKMADAGWLPESRWPLERVMHLRKYFEIVQLKLLQDPLVTRIACRRVADGEKYDYALYAWAQRAKFEAREIATKPIHLKKLSFIIPQLRAMTQKTPDVFCEQLVTQLADCGIALVFLPHIGGAFLHGATFLDGNKIVVGLTVDGKEADRFWFSLFHELAHILLGHINQPEGTSAEDEIAADDFAKNTLISPEDYKVLLSSGNFSEDAVRLFASRIGISPGVVVGRLQKEEQILGDTLNHLKVIYPIKHTSDLPERTPPQ